MKRISTLVLVFISVLAYAQPVIQNGNNALTAGATGDVYVTVLTTGVGSAGANQTWDFSGLTIPKAGTYTFHAVSTSPFATNYPNANLVFSTTPTGSSTPQYLYFENSSTKLDAIAFVTTPGTGNDYSPNPKTRLIYPFNYTDTYQDMWQKVGGSVNLVDITYDGYGTLKLPFATYNDVVRVKSAYGSNDDYEWWSVNPLMMIAVHSAGNGNLTILASGTSGIETDNGNGIHGVSIFPNPSQGKCFLNVNASDYTNMKVQLRNVLGQLVSEMTVNSAYTDLDLSGAAKGIYTYQVFKGAAPQFSGKFLVE